MSKGKMVLNGALLGLAGLLVAPGAVSAGSLQIEPATRSAAEAANGFRFVIRNAGAGDFGEVRVFTDSRHVATCAADTALARGFSLPGLLAAGDSVECSVRAGANGLRSNASVVVISRDAGGNLQQRSLSVARPMAALDEGIVAVLGASVHNDASADGILDAGETLDYDYTVLNLGNLALSGLALTDIDGVVSCPVTTLGIGATTDCTSTHVITASEDADGFVVNEISVAGSDSNGGPVEAGDMVLRIDLGPRADIRAVKSPALADDADASGYASVGDLVTYTFVLRNSGETELASVDLVEPDPTRIDTPISCAATTLAGQAFAGLGSGTLDPLDSVLCTADYTITAADAAAGEATNLAVVSGQPPSGGPVSGAAASDLVIPTLADIDLSKALVGESGSLSGVAEAGETLVYEITLTNPGSLPVTPFAVTDVLDPNVVFVTASHGGTEAGGVVSWSGLTVPGNGSLVLSVTVTVVDPIPPGTTHIANLAHETGTTPPACPPAAPQCVVTPTEGWVTLEKALVGESGSEPGIAEPGEFLTYQIVLSNGGGAAVSGYGVTDQLDPHTSFVSADHGGTEAGGIVQWNGLVIPGSGTLVLTVVVQVDDPLPGTLGQIRNLAWETGTTPPPCPPEAPQCVITEVSPNPSLDLVKTATSGAGPYHEGDTVSYAFLVTNNGNVALDNVIVTDPLPGMSPIAGCAPIALPATMQPGESTTCYATYVITADDVAHGGVENVATATGEDSTTHIAVSDSDVVTVATATVLPPYDAVPVRGPWMLALLFALLGLLGWRELVVRRS